MKIVNILGQEVAFLVDNFLDSGVYSVLWDGENSFGEPVGTGVYFCCLVAGFEWAIQKVTLL